MRRTVEIIIINKNIEEIFLQDNKLKNFQISKYYKNNFLHTKIKAKNIDSYFLNFQ